MFGSAALGQQSKRVIKTGTIPHGIPVASTPNRACGSYLTFPVSLQCAYTAHYPWFAAGAGWSTVTSNANTGTEPVSYQLNFVSAQGANALVHIGTVSGPMQGNGYTVPLAPGFADDTAITSVSQQVGSVLEIVMAADAATLDAQKAAQLTLILHAGGWQPDVAGRGSFDPRFGRRRCMGISVH